MLTPLNVIAGAGGAAATILVAGVSGATTGYQKFQMGSLTPEEALGEVNVQVSTSDGSPDLATVEWDPATLPETFWSQITVSGIYSGGQQTVVWDRVANNFFYQPNTGGNTRWFSNSLINANTLMINGNTYEVTFA